MPDKTVKSVVEVYLSGILSRARASMVCLLNNGLYSNPYRHQGNSRIENVHNFLKQTLTKFLSSSDVEWDRLLHLPVTASIQHQHQTIWKVCFS